MFERYNAGTDADRRRTIQNLATYVESLPAERKVVPLPGRGA